MLLKDQLKITISIPIWHIIINCDNKEETKIKVSVIFCSLDCVQSCRDIMELRQLVLVLEGFVPRLRRRIDASKDSRLTLLCVEPEFIEKVGGWIPSIQRHRN